MRSLSPAVLLALLAASCAPPSPSTGTAPRGPTPILEETSTGLSYRLNNDTEAVVYRVDAPVDHVWALLPEVYRELGIPEGTRDPAARVYGNRRAPVARVGGERVSAFLRCGNEEGAGPSAVTRFRVHLAALTSLEPVGDRTRVTTEVAGSATPIEGTSTGPVLCVSTGVLEKRIVELLTARLAAPGTERR
ncbi:MAG TPA: hypothetical protein VHG28_02065 [Longimicrobiaceae bacterium]|nr:hypothetical protein [Longimicrobiaceae bacterium]